MRLGLQYIVSPSGAIGLPDAVVGTLRLEAAFGYLRTADR